MNRTKNLVSVVITCYNQAHFLSEAIESVLTQTHTRFEIIVVDDGSTDDAAQVAAPYSGVRYIHQKNQGVSAARNAGLRRGEGEFTLFLDADDRLPPHSLEVGVTALREHPMCAFAYGHVELIDSDGSPLPPVKRPYVEKDHYLTCLARNDIWTPGQVLYRSTVFDSPGCGFDPSAGNAADFELNLRISRDNPVFCHDQVVLQYRLHGTNTSGDPALMLKSLVDVYHMQRKHVKGKYLFAAAFEAGLREGRSYYGEPLIDRLRTDIRARKWKRVARDMWTLLRYHPGGLARRVGQKLYRRAARDEST